MLKLAAETARNAALGELLMAKVTDELDDATFQQGASALI